MFWLDFQLFIPFRFSLQFSVFQPSPGRDLQKDFFFSLQGEKIALHLAAILL
jgi:hypothetical protein